MYSIGLDISKASISVHIPINSLDLQIDKIDAIMLSKAITIAKIIIHLL